MSLSSLNRRELLATAGAGAAAALFDTRAEAQQTPGAVVFTNTSVVTVDEVRHNVALAVVDGRIAAIGPTAEVQARYPRAEVYDGRGKALLPGLINCHAHLAQTLSRGFNAGSYTHLTLPTSDLV